MKAVEYEVTMEEVTFIPITNSQRNIQKTSTFLYFTACVVTTLSNMTLGLMSVWISPVAPKLQSENLEVNPLSRPITTVQLSIIASLTSLGFIGGPFFTGLFDKFGRRTMLMIISLLVLGTMIAMAYATDIHMIYVELAINIICLGATYSGATMYLSEISDEHDRAKIVCIGFCGLPLGNFMCYVFSSTTSSVRYFTLLSAVPAAVCLVFTFLFLPETPVYLVSRGRLEEASVVLGKLRNKTEEALQKELRYIAYVLEQTARTDNGRFKSLFIDRANRRALIVALGVHLINLCCGSPAIMSYLSTIFDQAGEAIPSDFATILLTLLQLVAVCIATQVVDKFGRRTLLISSTIICPLTLFSLGVFFYLKNCKVEFIEHVAWWPLVALIVFYTSISFGVGPLCWIITSELFPSNVMSAALSIVILVDGIAILVSVFMFPLLMEALGIHWIFWGFSVGFSLGFFFVYFVVPESRRKNILEIRNILISS